MTVGPTLLTANAVARGPLSLVGETLTGIVVKSAGIETEDSAATRSTIADIVANESDAVGYTRLALTVDSVVLRDDNEAWLVFVTVTDGADLSAEADQGGIWLALDTDDLVGFNVDDTGSGSADYAPTWDDGYAQFSIESVASLTVAGVPFGVTGNVPAAALAAALELVLGAAGTFRALADAPSTDPTDQQVPVWDTGTERFVWSDPPATTGDWVDLLDAPEDATLPGWVNPQSILIGYDAPGWPGMRYRILASGQVEFQGAALYLDGMGDPASPTPGGLIVTLPAEAWPLEAPPVVAFELDVSLVPSFATAAVLINGEVHTSSAMTGVAVVIPSVVWDPA